MTCDRVIKNSRAVLNFQRSGNLMHPICHEFNNNCTEIWQTKKDKTKSSR